MLPIQSTLFLIPTSKERDLFAEIWKLRFERPFPGVLYPCGFGPIAAGISTSHHLRPNHDRVCLMGIAGSLDEDRFPVGQASWFSQVVTDCVGAENNSDDSSNLLLPSKLGFPQWEAQLPTNVYEDLPLSRISEADDSRSLLTVGVASGTAATLMRRRQMFPECIAEDMEGFSVALAAKIAGVDAVIIRGASNLAGDRDHSHWRIKDAMVAVVDLLQPLICY